MPKNTEKKQVPQSKINFSFWTKKNDEEKETQKK